MIANDGDDQMSRMVENDLEQTSQYMLVVREWEVMSTEDEY